MIKKQTDYEFRESFKDYMYSYINLVLGRNKNYYFITFQPDKLSCLMPHLINQLTRSVFGDLAYVAVFEETNKKKKKNILANYIGNWHSHLIILEEDYHKFRELFTDDKIRARSVYDLDGLINYLSKQAAENRLLPTKNFGQKAPEITSVNKVKEPIVKRIIKAVDYTLNVVDDLMGIISPAFYTGQVYYQLLNPKKYLAFCFYSSSTNTT